MRLRQRLRGAQDAVLRCFSRKDEDADETFRKRCLVSTMLASLPLAIIMLVVRTQNPVQVGIVGSVLVMILLANAYIAVTKSLSVPETEAIIVLLGLRLTLGGDFETYGQGEEWAVGILMLDGFLITGCRTKNMLRCMYVIIAGYFFQACLHVFDTGIYESLPDLSASYDFDRLSPPAALTRFGLRAFVLYSAITLTVYFATGLRKQQERMQQAAEAAGRIASALVEFDLDLAEEELEGSVMDEGLQVALRGLLENLRTYRPFLPDALFREREGEVSPVRAPPEGDGVTIVFTDIQSSTAIWDSCPTGMRKAMAVHDSVIRAALEAHNGYEVKTIGDAFMVAFDGPREGVGFAVAVQERLHAACWPEEVLEHPLCQKGKLWNGLRVRIGVHTGGGVEMRINPVTGRADYFGPVVNAASRIEGVAHGGVITMSEAVYNAVQGERMVCVCLGESHLKGVSVPVVVYGATPVHLAGRLHEVPEAVPTSRTPSRGPTPIAHSMGEPLTNHTVSVASVRVDYSSVQSYHLLQATADIVECAGRTDGKVLSVCSSFVVVAWNIGAPCRGHHIRAAHFAGHLRRQLSPCFARRTTAGLSAGGVVKGTTGTRERRFVLVVGQCVELAGALASAACDLGTFALAGATPGHMCVGHDPSMRHATRKVGLWDVDNGVVEMFEVDMKGVLVVAHHLSEGEVQWGWSEGYDEAFEKRDFGTLRSHAIDDPVLQRVVAMLQEGSRPACPIPNNYLSDVSHHAEDLDSLDRDALQ